MNIPEYLEWINKNHTCVIRGVFKNIIGRQDRKYFRIISVLSNGQESALQFIHPETLDVFNAAGWKQKGRKVFNLGTFSG